ncbi:hypothetical protein [Mycobacterium sp. AZCC_0083]|uniref:hypothetical protein n=1 Tax=Mycobacterium sp. AZCC_0083 TaxID=2735882 RepID=UPI0017A6E5C5|nr:hypothetical protein [Mycobacterium sp. AZCC_0083]MBB5167249.1 hypothetical protein [Mycobacterium sp. AZCC_0083]
MAISAIVEPGGMAPGAGNGPGRRLASGSPQSVFTASGAVVTYCVPDGNTATGETVTGAGDAEDSHPAAASASANSVVAIRTLTGTP